MAPDPHKKFKDAYDATLKLKGLAEAAYNRAWNALPNDVKVKDPIGEIFLFNAAVLEFTDQIKAKNPDYISCAAWHAFIGSTVSDWNLIKQTDFSGNLSITKFCNDVRKNPQILFPVDGPTAPTGRRPRPRGVKRSP